MPWLRQRLFVDLHDEHIMLVPMRFQRAAATEAQIGVNPGACPRRRSIASEPPDFGA